MNEIHSAARQGGGARRALLASSALAAALGICAPAFAQDAPGDGVPQDEIVVTGSSIRGVAPVGSQMIGVTRDVIQNTAPANTKDLMATVPQLGNFGTNAEQSTSNRFRTAGFYPNIHNVGIYATLTLINGHRIAPTGGEAVFPDPSIVPTIALQRVEIVADGGSAIYGSDAVAGVVNFLYRKNVEGIEAQATYGFNGTRYLKANAAILGGHRWSTGGVMLAYEFSKNKHPLNTEIPLLARGGDQRGFGTETYPGRDQRGTNCLLPNLNIVSTRNVAGGVTDLRGTNYAYNEDGSVSAGTNRCGVLSESPILGDSQRHAVLLTANQQLGEHVTMWAEVNWSKYNTSSFGGQSSIAARMVDSNPYFDLGLPAGMTRDDILSVDNQGRKYYMVRRSGLGLWEPRDPSSVQYAKMLAITAGVDIDVGGDWRITQSVHVSKTNDYNSDPELDPLMLQNALESSDPAVALNPFGSAANNSAATLASINNNYRRDNTSSQRLREVQAKADGPLFTVGGGEARVAVGVDLRNEQAVQLQTSGTPARAADMFIVRDDNISRDVFAGFAELNVPFISSQNALPWMRRLTLSLAGRADYYAAYGTRFNPKVGLVLEPIDGWSVHGSYGTSFVAPNVGMITNKFGFVGSQNSSGAFTYTFPADVPGVGGQTILIGNQPGTIAPTYNMYNSGGGNPDLQPEKATTWSLGIDIAPPQVPGLRFSVGYYNVLYKNTIYKATTNDVFYKPGFEYLLTVSPTIGQGISNPWMDAALAAEFADSPPEMDVASYTVWDIIFRSYAVNIGSRKFEGLDFDGSYDFNTSFGHFTIAGNANLKLVDTQKVTPSDPYVSRLGSDQAVRWKGRGTLNWSLDDVNLNLAMNYVGGYELVTGVGTYGGTQKVKPWTTFDLAARYSLEKLIKGFSIQGRIANLFDRDPPWVDSGTGYSAANSNAYGRMFEVTVRASF